MVTSLKLKEAFIQYSKKMCTRVTLFWMIYRIANFLVVLLRPEIASALVDLSTGVDTIMIVNMGAYTFNSGTEKVAIAFGKNTIRPREKSEEDESEEEDKSEEDESEKKEEEGDAVG